ncbi:MAG: MiaB/RimO family radical SAM methylthiotransferase [Lachnospiraceae bacterium]|nr:MiaB/RimO family radical SAM methylthiotransferase [Lachnospiraceae bacterium]
MFSVAFHNLGCKVNSYELDVVQQNFINKGYTVVPFDQFADIYVVNTCSVTNIADRKSRQMLHRAKERNPKAVVVALGCYVEASPAVDQTDDAVDLAIGNHEKRNTVELVEDFMKTGRRPAQIPALEAKEYEDMFLERAMEHTRAYIKIQDGCDQYCTYCIIPFTRGHVRSRSVPEICKEVRGLVAKGYKEIVLTGIHISSYGIDFEGSDPEKEMSLPKEKVRYGRGYSLFLSLIEQVHKIEGVERIRLGSLEPQIVTEEFAKTLASLPKVCPHFHLSLQSGCDATLKRMNRRYTTEDFLVGVDRLRKYYDAPAITTDVIVGFPGETEEEFSETKAFLRRIRFFEMHIFPFSLRKGTYAEKLDGHLNNAVKKARSAELLQMEAEDSLAYRQQFLGAAQTVLFEEIKEIDGRSYMIGHTERYVKAALPVAEDVKKAEEHYKGRSVKGVFTRMLTDEICLMEETAEKG